MNRFRQPALIFLWLDVAASFVVAAFTLLDGPITTYSVITTIGIIFGGVVLAWWATIFGRVSRGLGVPATDGTLRSLALSYPWLTAYNLSRWGMFLLGVLAGAAPEANPVALTALITIWGAAVLTSNAVNSHLVRLASGPDEAVPTNAARLCDWLNLYAAVGAGLAVMNLVPIKGLDVTPTPPLMQVVYTAASVIDIVAMLLSLLAIRQAVSGPLPSGKSSGSQGS